MHLDPTRGLCVDADPVEHDIERHLKAEHISLWLRCDMGSRLSMHGCDFQRSWRYHVPFFPWM